ncbi:unnamed protein product [Trifolium pratense]|uniref:Uncharacterized protein n=1 Tax=Trifolium pratense TaxID=57577 RepID=A0ACB0M9J7_TRIPR|nr:unnamed protein product [Trifolium pratense]
MAKTLAMLLLFLQLTSFIAFAEHLETLPPTYPPHHSHSPLHPPTKSPHHPPSNAPHHHHHHHNHTPSPAPSPISHTPSHPPHHSTPVPAKPPTGHHHHHHPPAFAPVKPPVHTPVVPTHPPLHPLTKYKFVQTHKTDKNGYFFIERPKNIKTYAPHKCNVVLVSAPNGLKPSNLNGGLTGAALRSGKPYVSKGLHFTIYTVGPLAFEPKCPR